MQIIKVDGSKRIALGDIATTAETGYEQKDMLKKRLKQNIKRMAELQNMLYAQGKYALLIVFQAMDAAGKDSMIRRVMTGLNPQGTQVYSFKQPTTEDLDHDYLWKSHKRLPERGRIGIFNRSYYEEVLVVRVHNLVKARNIPDELITDDIWTQRFAQMKGFEEYIGANGTATLKFFLHISKEEQRRRFLSRIEDPSKNWKFSASDLKEREYWDQYQHCYEDTINSTGSEYAPWYVIPSDNKWYARLMVSQIIIARMEQMKLDYPQLNKQQTVSIKACRKQLDTPCIIE